MFLFDDSVVKHVEENDKMLDSKDRQCSRHSLFLAAVAQCVTSTNWYSMKEKGYVLATSLFSYFCRQRSIFLLAKPVRTFSPPCWSRLNPVPWMQIEVLRDPENCIHFRDLGECIHIRYLMLSNILKHMKLIRHLFMQNNQNPKESYHLICQKPLAHAYHHKYIS